MKTIGKYVVKGVLGKGGMSVVYKALLPVVDRLTALKLLNPHPNLVQLLGEKEVHRKFVSEARIMARIRHPNIVSVLDFDSAEGRPFFTMEYYYRNLGALIGESYRADSPSRVLSLDRIIRYMRPILRGLSALHRAGIIHRDIKPYNILITDDDSIKITDFGASKLRGETAMRSPSGLMLGSPFYAAPEQEIDPENVDERADIYPVGVILYRALTGRLPEDGGPRPSDIHPDADDRWDRFVFKALSKDRRSRFPGADEMLRELEVLADGWERKKPELCRFAGEGTDDRRQAGATPLKLRRSPLKVSLKDASKVFGCDDLRRPMRYLRKRNFERPAPGLILDLETRLVWRAGGPEDPLTWVEARAYVSSLNRSEFGGFTRWRLPTVNELFSLLKPVAFGEEDCVEPIFERGPNRLWSIDRCAYASAWYVDCELGFAERGDFTCRFFAAAVCSEWEDASAESGREE